MKELTPGNVFDLRFFKGYLSFALKLSTKKGYKGVCLFCNFPIRFSRYQTQIHKNTHTVVMPTNAVLVLFDVCLWFWLIGFV